MNRDLKPTIKNVAHLAGVSTSTVSLVLQNKGNLPEHTREKVRDAVIKTGYQRSKTRNSKAKMNAVGIIADDIENPYYGELFRAIDDTLEGSGLVPILLSANGQIARQSLLLESLGRWGCAGAILIPANASGKETLDLIKSLDIPVTLGVRHLGFGEYDYVGPNYFQGMQMATSHLIDLGHRRIAFVGGESENTAYSERRAGFQLTASNTPEMEIKTYEIEGSPTSQFGADIMPEIMAMDMPPTAIIAYNDQLAFGLMSSARDMGITPGKDISIIGFDDIRASALRNVPLTTVSTSPSRIGMELGRLLLARVEDSSAQPVSIIPPPLLKIRKSCGAPKNLVSVESAKNKQPRTQSRNS